MSGDGEDSKVFPDLEQAGIKSSLGNRKNK